MDAKKLTPEQRDAIIKLGSPTLENPIIFNNVRSQLIDLGILYKRGKDWYDFTDLGEEIYEDIK